MAVFLRAPAVQRSGSGSQRRERGRLWLDSPADATGRQASLRCVSSTVGGKLVPGPRKSFNMKRLKSSWTEANYGLRFQSGKAEYYVFALMAARAFEKRRQ
jgi:hypothetical protein